MDVDVVVAGGTAITPAGRTDEPIGVVDGRIVQIGGPMDAPRVVDASGCFVVPGAVDPHVHLSAPGSDPLEAFADDFESGTRAALAGGVTTIGQMSFPDGPDETVRQALERDRSGLADLACSDWFLHPSSVYADAQAAADVTWCAEQGHPSFKTTLMGLDASAGAGPDGAARLVAAFEAAAAAGVTVLVHCEDFVLIDHRTQVLDEAGAGVARYPESRPTLTERASVERAVALAEATGAELYVVHVSSREAVQVIARARARGLPVLAETRPIYLSQFADRYERPDGGLVATMPPLREPDDAAALFAALGDGTIDTIGSDHAPWTLEQRASWPGSLASLRKGVAELDTYWPLLFETAVLAGRLTLEQLVEAVAAAPARIFGLRDKGRLEVGADADLVVLDPEQRRRVDPAALQSRAGHSPYDGLELRGWPRVVLRRGETVVDGGRVDVRTGSGAPARRVRRGVVGGSS